MTEKLKLLVVEDQANERSAMARLLTMDGYEALTAKDAREALDQISEPVALVITDLKMPDLSGVELLRRWKAQRPETPFIMVTAYAAIDSAVAAMKLGAKDYLTKPIDPEALSSLVASILAERAVPPDQALSRETDALQSPGREPRRLEDLEKDAVLRVLEQEGGNRTHAARLLGISIRTLQRKLKAWGLATEHSDADEHT